MTIALLVVRSALNLARLARAILRLLVVVVYLIILYLGVYVSLTVLLSSTPTLPNVWLANLLVLLASGLAFVSAVLLTFLWLLLTAPVSRGVRMDMFL